MTQVPIYTQAVIDAAKEIAKTHYEKMNVYEGSNSKGYNSKLPLTKKQKRAREKSKRAKKAKKLNKKRP